jgi:glycosyltransferase involved in cell wall biosynthesis
VDDDSGDGTAALVRQLGLSDPRVRIVQRIRRRGLSSAVIEGMLAIAAPYLAVMDGDLQHDERLLPVLLDQLQHENLDIVIASRHIQGGSVGEFSRPRALLSSLGKKLSRFVCHYDVTDPMSGYFLLSRSLLEVSCPWLLVSAHLAWYAAGFAGMVVSSVWNFGVTAMFTWCRARRMAGQACDDSFALPLMAGRAPGDCAQ